MSDKLTVRTKETADSGEIFCVFWIPISLPIHLPELRPLLALWSRKISTDQTVNGGLGASESLRQFICF